MKKLLLLNCALILAFSAHADTQTEKNPFRSWLKKNHVYAKAGMGAVFFKKLSPQTHPGILAPYEKKKPKDTFSLSFAGGVNVNKRISTELQFRYNDLDYSYASSKGRDTQKVRMYSLFTNAYLKANQIIKFVPYVVGGVGIARNNSKNFNVKSTVGSGVRPGKTYTRFAWNVGTGVMYEFSKKIFADLNYRYYSLGKIGSGSANLSNDPASYSKVKNQEVSVGLIYNF